MTQSQDIARRGVALLPQLTADQLAGYTEITFQREGLDALVSALTLLEPVAAGTHIIVPVEPTEEMIRACHTALYHWREKVAKDPQQDPPWDEKHAIRYRAMIAASSKPEGREG